VLRKPVLEGVCAGICTTFGNVEVLLEADVVRYLLEGRNCPAPVMNPELPGSVNEMTEVEYRPEVMPFLSRCSHAGHDLLITPTSIFRVVALPRRLTPSFSCYPAPGVISHS